MRLFLQVKCWTLSVQQEMMDCGLYVFLLMWFTGNLCHSEQQWHVAHYATMTSAKVARGGRADLCTLWQLNTKEMPR